jgi:ferredoxin-nitrite reductase
MTTEAGSDLKLAGATATGAFEPEQKRYLEGFAAGLQIAKTAKGLSGSLAGSAAGLTGALAAPEPVGPDAAAFKAQDRVLKAGGKLSDPEKFKREQHPFDSY